MVAGAVGRLLERVGRARRVGLVLPDPVARVSLIRFEQVPPRAHDLDQLIRWQVRKAAPFPIEGTRAEIRARTVTGSASCPHAAKARAIK